ncbi:Gfo/Idh/MocA family oxidoreductase [uncultured Pelagimonas sp.]|uniref:Gfo/Idh/MocA family protein n=1 Tax=uncultured Pelagimonas sp. TaxID=1618102 RepID=UPI002624BCC4|nr:Gfo/Idh/MocA family oxidoreductase [uncultured Pelagimonas sp.]
MPHEAPVILSDDVPTPARALSWGILGTGKIARQFADELITLPSARLAGVASRTAANAAEFVQQFGDGIDAKAYESYAALCADPEIDLVYIATPTGSHAELCRMALMADKAVLCEKPFCSNAAEAAEIFALAKARGLFVMEAMWMRFNPLIQKAKRLLEEGAIGDVRTLHAELGYAKNADVLGQASEGRGARLAFGCYGASLAVFLFGAPLSSSLHVVRTETGAEDSVALVLEYPSLVVSLLFSEWATLGNEVRIRGRGGNLVIGDPFINATSLQLTSFERLQQRSVREKLEDRLRRLFGRDRAGDVSCFNAGFREEAEETMRCMHAGLLESPKMPHAETLLVHRLLETG